MNLFGLHLGRHDFADKREGILASIAGSRAKLEAMPASRDVYHDYEMLDLLEKQMLTTLAAPRRER